MIFAAVLYTKDIKIAGYIFYLFDKVSLYI